MEDPYFIVKSDVEKALDNLSKLHQSFQLLSISSSPGQQNKELNEVRGEIKTALRDVQYDIEDIEETVRIVDANPKKFKISSNEIESRKQFISRSKDKLASIEAAISNTKSAHLNLGNKPTNSSGGGDQRGSTKSGIGGFAKSFGGTKSSRSGGGSINSSSVKYAKLEAYQEEENEKFIDSTMREQQQLIQQQDEEVERVTTSIGVLKSMSRQIGDELDHQNDILDDLNQEMDSTQSKMDNVMKKLAKVTRLSDDKRQWTVIFILSLIILVLFLLLILL